IDGSGQSEQAPPLDLSKYSELLGLIPHLSGGGIRPVPSGALLERVSRLCRIHVGRRQRRLERSRGAIGPITRPPFLGELRSPCLQLLSFAGKIRLQPGAPIKRVQTVDDLPHRRALAIMMTGALTVLGERNPEPLLEL